MTLWIGPELGFLERACLRSVLRQGHPVTLYCYEPPAGVPAGVELADASTILPIDCLVAHRRGSVALFSDWFRFEAQRRGLGIWLDCDVYLLAPLDGAPILLGESAPGAIESAVLRLPPDCPVLPALIAPFRQRTVPVWMSRRSRGAALLRLWGTGRTGIDRMPWGTLGPYALSWAVRSSGPGSALAQAVQPTTRFYPVHWRDACWIVDPAQPLENRVSPGTVAVHLWSECLRAVREGPAPAGSMLARLRAEGAAA